MNDAATASRAAMRAAWQARAPRERVLIGVAAAAVAVLLLWLLALQPALQTLRQAPAQIDALDLQLQQMQRLAAEARELRAAPPVTAEQSLAALRASVERLGGKARLVQQGDRVVVTLDTLPTAPLRELLAEARQAARARPLEATLTRAPQGFSGTLVLALPGAAR